MTPKQMAIIRAIGEQGDVPASLVAERAGYTGRTGSPYGGAARCSQWVASMVQRMPKGLIVSIYPRDASGLRYHLTEAGRQALASFQQDDRP